MYGFENETYLKVLHGAVDNIEVIKDIIEKVEEKGFDNVFLVGTGGTYSMVSPLAYMLKTNSTLEWYYEIAAELVAAKPKKLGERSLMITASLSGTTKETIAAAEYATSVGATVISLVGEADSPLGVASTYAVANEASNDNLCEEIYMQLFTIGALLMKANGDFPECDRFLENLRKMPEALLKVREKNDERALAFAEKHKDTKFHMCVGAGNTWGETYCFAMCVLEEMQWIATKSIHAAEFFHGTVEMTENFKCQFYNTGVMINGIVNTLESIPIIEPSTPLRKIREEREGLNEYFLTEIQIDKFKSLRKGKSVPRTRPNGEPYTYSEGNMAFPDSLDSPGRTMLTSEASINRSTHVIKDAATDNLRFITPIEAERLQSFPKNWTNTGMPQKRRYFMMGNALVTQIINRLENTLSNIITNEP